MDPLEKALTEFRERHGFNGPGPLSVLVVLTDRARVEGLPLDPAQLVTPKGGQVSKVSSKRVQRVLNRHGETRVLSSEAGRTSRGSMETMRLYVAFLNELNERGVPDFDTIEKFWADRVKEFLDSQPFILRYDVSQGLRTIVRDLLAQARERQRTMPGRQLTGTVLQHLVGAKLETVSDEPIKHHSSSTADDASRRAGDFVVGDVAVHVTTSPGEALVDKCRENLHSSLQPVIVTTGQGVDAAELWAREKGLEGRIDVLDAEQFLASNLYELGAFKANGRREAVSKLINHYNRIIDQAETDPSLKIEVQT
jgi:hypothetical protein